MIILKSSLIIYKLVMVNVFSFCLYGPQIPRYYDGMLSNIELIKTHYPTWKTYIYTGSDVTEEFIRILKSYSNVVIRPTGKTGPRNMIDRFFAIDEPDVELMEVRDADSRIHWKDRWAINQFVNSKFKVHAIRDNPCHCYPLLGGLWGMRKINGLSIRSAYEKFKLNPTDGGIGLDQDFLNHCLYELLDGRVILAHVSIHYKTRKDVLVEFPFKYTNDIYCGRIEDSSFKDRSEIVQLTSKINIPRLSINFPK